jgi:hypothetical protein
MSDLVPTRGDLLRGGRRPWEAPLLSVLSFRATAGTQQAGADNPQVASFTPGSSSSPNPPESIIPQKGSLACDGGFPSPVGNAPGFSGTGKGGVLADINLCAATS